MLTKKQLNLNMYLKIEKEINGLNTRKLKKETRKKYKRYCLKFIKTLLENSIKITSIRNIKNEHLKIYGKLMLALGRNLKTIIEELRGVVFWYTVANNGYVYTRYQHLMDLRILKKYLEEQESKKNED